MTELSFVNMCQVALPYALQCIHFVPCRNTMLSLKDFKAYEHTGGGGVRKTEDHCSVPIDLGKTMVEPR
jgi:hypothetical protein